MVDWRGEVSGGCMGGDVGWRGYERRGEVAGEGE